jgi:hypothetical protein
MPNDFYTYQTYFSYDGQFKRNRVKLENTYDYVFEGYDEETRHKVKRKETRLVSSRKLKAEQAAQPTYDPYEYIYYDKRMTRQKKSVVRDRQAQKASGGSVAPAPPPQPPPFSLDSVFTFFSPPAPPAPPAPPPQPTYDPYEYLYYNTRTDETKKVRR